MADGSKKGMVIAAMAAIVGTSSWEHHTGVMSAHVQQEDRRLRWAQDSYQFAKGDSVEEVQIRLFVEQLRNLSMMSSETVRRLAEVTRSYPGCSDKFTVACKRFWVDGILAMRQELKAGSATAEDIDLLLQEKYSAAGGAAGRLRAAGR